MSVQLSASRSSSSADARLELRDPLLDPVELGRPLPDGSGLRLPAAARFGGLGRRRRVAATCSRSRTRSAQPPSYERSAQILDRDDPVGRRRRGARGRARRAAPFRGTPRARPRAPRGSRGRGGSSARRARAGSRPRRRRARARAAAARRPRAPTPASRASPSRRRGSGRGGSAPAAAGARSSLRRRRGSSPGLGSSASCCEKYAGHDAVAELDAPLVRLPLPEERLEQRRLAGAVRADERDVLAPLEHERGAVEQQLVAGGDDEVRPPRATIRPVRAGLRNSKPSVRRRFVSDSSSSAAARRSCSSRPICVSFACACFAFDFL